MERHASAMASFGESRPDHGRSNHTRRCLCPHDRFVGLRNGHPADVALDYFWTVLRGRRDLLRHRRFDRRHGYTTEGIPSGSLFEARSLQQSRTATPYDELAVVLLHFLRVPDRLLWK